jgi:tRNA modification GTPase
MDTIAAIATPSGFGGIGIVRISGPDAFAIAARVFCERGKPPEIRGRGMHVGWVVDPATGARIDHAILLAFPAPHSYTTEDVAEIQGHGGPALCGRVLRHVLACGARLAAPGEFTKRAFLGGRIDLAQAEAVADLIEARGERALDLAVAQLEGRLSRAVRDGREACIELLARIEAVLDFPDDVSAVDGAALSGEMQAVRDMVEALLATSGTGQLARNGATLAIIGRPNVGKSSLLNALVQAERAIVTAIPGTTRDVVEVAFQFSGIPVRMLDTAGIRPADDEVEAIGIARSRKHLAEADLRIWVVDASAGLTAEDQAIGEALEGLPTIQIANKADLIGPTRERRPNASDALAPFLKVSALTGQGLPDLEARILRALPGAVAPGEVAINARHQAALLQASAALARAIEAAGSDLPLDCAATDIREAAGHLGQVVGTDLTEAMLDVLFLRFCIGK